MKNFFQIYESFETAVKVIEPRFSSAFHASEWPSRDDMLLSLPWATLVSFQVEVALKHLISITGTVPPRIHDLEKLFNLLPETSSNIIRLKMNEFDFETELKKVSNLFVSSRYLTEDGASYLPAFLKIFRDSLDAEVRQSRTKGIKVYRGLGGEWKEVE